MQPLTRTRLRLHLLRVNNAKCAEHFCIFKHALERATPHCPPPRTALLLQLETQNAPQKIIERVGNTRTRSSWVQNELRLFCSTLKMFSFCCFRVLQFFFISSFPFLLFFLFEIRNMSNICGQESKEKCLDKLTPSEMKHEKF